MFHVLKYNACITMYIMYIPIYDACITMLPVEI